MKVYEIRLSTIEDVKQFVRAVTLFDGDVDLSSGRYIVDAKSVMGIFSLDLLHPLKMTVHADECADLEREIAGFLTE